MDSPDQRGAVSWLVHVLRRITRVVQVAPFAYLLVLSCYLLLESVMPGWMLRLMDNLLNAPLYVVVGMLGIGRILKLCSWFRTACVLPFATKVEGYVDSFVYSFTQNEVALVNALTGVAFVIFLAYANHHFFNGRGKETAS